MIQLLSIKKIRPQHHFRLALVLVVICGIWGQRQAYLGILQRPDTNILMGDPVDTPLIVHGLVTTPRFGDTIKWWYGPWVDGEYCAFYRPLSSLVWWSEFQVFGMERLWGFAGVHALSHLFVLVVALLFLRELIGLKHATLSVSIFAIHTPLLFLGLPSSIWALEMWKDDPDLWCSGAILLALWCFLLFLRKQSSKWLVGCGFLFVLGLTFKETAYIIPLLLPLLLWYEKKLCTHWRYIIPFYGSAIAAFIFRWWALQGLGFRFGTNGSWLQRWFIYTVGGSSAATLTRGQGLSLAIACCVLALLWRFRDKSRW